MLNRLHNAAIITALAGMAALASFALKFSFIAAFACICLTTIAGFILVASLQKQKAMLDRAGQALGQFMRGQWHARLSPDHHDDEFSRLQHRINNLLDTVDLHLRGEQASIDMNAHADYAEKLRFTALYESLSQHKSLEDIKADRTPTESVGALLTQLGHNVADLFKPDAKPAESAVASPTHARQLRVIADRLQGATEQLAQRVVSHERHASQHAPLSAQSLDQVMARIAEQSSVISLNVAIEAARASQGSALGEMGMELHSIATQLHKARADMAALLATAAPTIETAPTVPLSFAIDALASAETALRSYIEADEKFNSVDEAA